MRRALVWLNLYGCEAVWRKLKNSLKTQKIFFSRPFDFFFASSNEKKQLIHMRYHFFVHHEWFLQNLGKEAVRTNMHTTVIIEFRSSFIKFFAQLCLPFFLFFFFAKVWKGKGEIFLGTNLDAISVKLGIDFNCFVFYRFPAHFLCQTLLDSGVRFLSSKYKCHLGYQI